MPPFNWTTFLLGFAIALWIALLVLFLLPDNDEPAPAPACPIAGCYGCCGFPPIGGPRTLWFPPGDDRYYCTNNDNGGGYVEDNGGGYVDDNGGGYVEDSSPRSPAPTSTELGGSERGIEEFQCRANDNGGGYVEDASRRSVTLPMPNTIDYACWVDGAKNATVLRIEGTGGATTYTRIRLDRRRNIVLLNEVAGVVNPVVAGVDTEEYLYCMVATATSQPIIINKTGQCKAGACP